MNAREQSGAETAPQHVDVLIAGAGISGIGSAYHLQQQCPGKSYAILEMKDTFGGTWETHKYPGVRSDSDLYTFGYRFKPWVGAPIASADEIEALHQASLEVLREIGLRVQDDRSLDLLQTAGADVDRETGRVRFDDALVEDMLTDLPDRFTIHARDPAKTLEIGGNLLAFATVSGPSFAFSVEGAVRDGPGEIRS